MAEKKQIDYEYMLLAYMDHVGRIESSDYLGYHGWPEGLTPEERKRLEEMKYEKFIPRREAENG